ncbi:MAG: PorT family protein [Chloroflexia bacterium]|nr:PorT family protein [Chloroflexia bacterium]
MPVYEGGLIFNYLDRNTGIQIGVNYTQKGWIENFQNGASAKLMLDCIEIPLLTQIRFSRYKKSGWVLLFGTYANYIIKTNEPFFGGEPDYTTDIEFVKYNELLYNTFEFGIKGGGGFEFGLGKNSLQLQVLFTQSFVNLFDSDREGIYRSLSQSLTVSAVYKFTLFRREQ